MSNSFQPSASSPSGEISKAGRLSVVNRDHAMKFSVLTNMTCRSGSKQTDRIFGGESMRYPGLGGLFTELEMSIPQEGGFVYC